MHKALTHRRAVGVQSQLPQPAGDTPVDRAGVGHRAHELLRDEVRLFRIAAAVIVVAVADDAFVHPEPGTAAWDHPASGLIPIAIALVAAAAYPRLSAGLRACIALVFGALALEAGMVVGIRHVLISNIAGNDVTAILGALAGWGSSPSARPRCGGRED